MESFSVDEVAGYRNAIITYVLNGASTKLPIKEREMATAINLKGRLFTMAMAHAKSALQEVRTFWQSPLQTLSFKYIST